MQFLKNLKHIFFISLLSLAILFGSVLLLFSDFLVPMNYFLIYRTGAGATFQDTIYTHSLEPSKNIVVVEIDEHTINTLQAKNELQMLSIPKKYYEHLVRILRSYNARAIGFDIIFQNADSTEADFIATLEASDDVTIGTLSADKKELKCIEDADGSTKTCE